MQRANAAFRDFAIDQCCARLEQTGLRRHAKGSGSLFAPINDAFQYWVGLNSGLYLTRVSLTPHFGVHVPQLDELVAEIRKSSEPKRKYDKRIATYTRAHTQLIKSPPQLDFAPAEDIEDSLERLVNLSTQVGLPFARSIASYEALLPLLRERVSMLGGYPERVACCLALMGQAEKALDFLREFAATDSHGKRFAVFIEAFADRVSSRNLADPVSAI
ncbi:MAG TPA: hypothetical protein VN229_18795 [Terriglobales bacterium]|nr:hypothetical protein [Terriglobales bacterium]